MPELKSRGHTQLDNNINDTSACNYNNKYFPPPFAYSENEYVFQGMAISTLSLKLQF